VTPQHCMSSGKKQVQQVTNQPALVQALPTSLRVLEVFEVPAEVLVQLTALERLRVEQIGSRDGSTCILHRLSALQRLTQLHLSCAGDEDLPAIAGCTGLRALCLDCLDCASLLAGSQFPSY
jgi:hypothetical protein